MELSKIKHSLPHKNKSKSLKATEAYNFNQLPNPQSRNSVVYFFLGIVMLLALISLAPGVSEAQLPEELLPHIASVITIPGNAPTLETSLLVKQIFSN